MSIGQAIRHFFHPEESEHQVAVSKRVDEAEKDLDKAAAANKEVTKRLEQKLSLNSHH